MASAVRLRNAPRVGRLLRMTKTEWLIDTSLRPTAESPQVSAGFCSRQVLFYWPHFSLGSA